MARQDHSPVTDQQRDEFLAGLAAGKSIVSAAGNESLRRKLYRMRDTDREFATAWADAWNEGTDALVHEARRRAVEGVPRRSYDKDGNLIRDEIVYSDALLMFQIKQRDPSYRDNVKIEHTGRDGGPVQLEHRGVKLADVFRVAREAGVEPGD
jgi:hypothetical protein